ncbi:Bit61 protein [Saccharomycopsis crataegensis]|uniref:Bit61 protein n=1 Tax=Saccharomycopsis crataegensis TaxID=43959 RepID=A0AAV5QUX3_9ASCO|nr:Bit61 protein [Saccharomycopsis crataegensis]
MSQRQQRQQVSQNTINFQTSGISTSEKNDNMSGMNRINSNHIKSPSIPGDQPAQKYNNVFPNQQAERLSLFRTKTENYQSALGINFESSKKAADSPNLSTYTMSPNADTGDHGFQPISRSNTFDFYKNSNNSDSSITPSFLNVGSTLNASISNLTFSPLSTTRTNASEGIVISPGLKEKTTPLEKARLFAQKASGKSSRDSFFPKRRTSNTDDAESILKGKAKLLQAGSSSKAKHDHKKNILPEFASLSKPRVPSASDGSSRRSSSENRRIPTTINELSDSTTIRNFSHHSHHHLKLKSRRDGVPNVLSSSSSNSKFISDFPALYSFHPSANTTSTNEVLRIVTNLEAEILSQPLTETKKNEYIDRLLHLLYSCVLPLFKGEILSTPIEDLNKLVEIYLMLRINNNDVEKELNDINLDSGDVSTSSDAKVIVKEFQDFIKVGISLMENQSNIDNVTHKYSRLNRFGGRFNHDSSSSTTLDSNSSVSSSSESQSCSRNSYEIENKVAALWDFFLHDILSYLEAIFLPLQMEFEGSGLILNNPAIAHSFWSQLLVSDDENMVRRYLLLVFRDSIIIPMVEKLGNVTNFFAEYHGNNISTEDVWRNDDFYAQKLCLLRCFGILSTTQAKDYNQKVVEGLLDIMKQQTRI